MNKYTKMQQVQYDLEASKWTLENRDAVVGAFDEHNSWKDYDIYLFKNIDTTNKLALDFGCGPGRNIVKFNKQFKQIDSIDISDINLQNAKTWIIANNIKILNLIKTNGIDLSNITNNHYDIVFSTICLQHICVHEIRFALLKEFYRVLKNDGNLCFQMGFGPSHPRSVGYYENFYDAKGTNSGCDTRVDTYEEIEKDLIKIGFKNFEYDIRPVGPGDVHDQWIFIRANK